MISLPPFPLPPPPCLSASLPLSPSPPHLLPLPVLSLLPPPSSLSLSLDSIPPSLIPLTSLLPPASSYPHLPLLLNVYLCYLLYFAIFTTNKIPFFSCLYTVIHGVTYCTTGLDAQRSTVPIESYFVGIVYFEQSPRDRALPKKAGPWAVSAPLRWRLFLSQRRGRSYLALNSHEFGLTQHWQDRSTRYLQEKEHQSKENAQRWRESKKKTDHWRDLRKSYKVFRRKKYQSRENAYRRRESKKKTDAHPP